MLEINITSNFLDVAEHFKDINQKFLYQSTRYAINRTLLTVRQASLDKLRKRIDIKQSTLRQKHIAITKARGTTWNNLQGVVSFNTDAIPMLEFVKGSKEVVKQKGVPIQRRRKVKVQIVPGKKFVLKKAFIQRVKTKQVFKRAEGQKDFHKQGIRSVGFIVMERGLGQELQNIAGQRFRTLFMQDLRARINGHVGKIKDPR